MAIKRPRRHRYESEPDFLLACLRYLDTKYPGREGQRKRLATWRRWNEEHDDAALRARILELIELDALSPDEDDELDRLIALWKAQRASVRPTPDIKKENME